MKTLSKTLYTFRVAFMQNKSLQFLKSCLSSFFSFFFKSEQFFVSKISSENKKHVSLFIRLVTPKKKYLTYWRDIFSANIYKLSILFVCPFVYSSKIDTEDSNCIWLLLAEVCQSTFETNLHNSETN